MLCKTTAIASQTDLCSCRLSAFRYVAFIVGPTNYGADGYKLIVPGICLRCIHTRIAQAL